jgi:hypothetical protein
MRTSDKNISCLVRFIVNGSEVGRMTARTLGRIKARISSKTQKYPRAELTFEGLVSYGNGHVNEFSAKTKTELFRLFEIFTAADEVKFIQDYWRE